MTVRAYYHHQLMVSCPACGNVFDIFLSLSSLVTNKQGEITDGITNCTECDNKFEFDTQYKE